MLTTVLDKKNVEGFASIVICLAGNSGADLSQEQLLLGYQWLEHMAMFANQAATNTSFARSFLEVSINNAYHFLTLQYINKNGVLCWTM